MDSVGGISGLGWHVYEMANCMTHDLDVSARRQGSGNTGMIIGMGKMSNCYSDVRVSSPKDITLRTPSGSAPPNSAMGIVLGGIYGSCNSFHTLDSECLSEATLVENCHAIGSIDTRVTHGTKIFNVGGFIGTVQDAKFVNCYSATPIISEDGRTGPFNGRQKNTDGLVNTFIRSYCSSEIAGKPMNLSGINVSAAAMKQQSTFVG